MYKRSSVIFVVDFSSETMEAKRQCDNIFKELKKRLSILYPEKLPLRMKEK